jgi:antitoxin VapB
MPIPTRAFKNGHSQAVRIPAELRFASTDIELEIEKVGEEIRIRPAKRKLTGLLDRFAAFPDDAFEQGRVEEIEVQRESF